MNDLRCLSMGVRCWPQWAGWNFCPHTGDLVDPAGQTYSPGTVQGGRWMLALREVRDRLIFADNGTTVPALETADMADGDGSLSGLRWRQQQAHHNSAIFDRHKP